MLKFRGSVGLILLLFFTAACSPLNLIQESTPTLPIPSSPDTVELRTWPLKQSISSNENQEIWVSIQKNGYPETDIQMVLVVNLPDGGRQPFILPPTDGSGRTYLLLPPVVASNATLIPYEVCLSLPVGERLCAEESFLIWNQE